MSLLTAYRRWRDAKHQQAIAAQYAPRLSAYRSIVAQAKTEQRKVVPINLLVIRAQRMRRSA